MSYPSSADLARRLGLPRAEVFDAVPSTLDVAHSLAAQGAPAGTLILADAQTAGRGRQGRAWSSEPGRGIWLTLIERPRDRSGIEVLSLRIGLGIAEALEALTHKPIRLKWPNDIYRDDRKLAGILVEARWRGPDPDWVAIGVGLNLQAPTDQAAAVGLEDSRVTRLDVLDAMVPAIRRAAANSGPLTEAEHARYTARDAARGRRIIEPVTGTVKGITASGALEVTTESGLMQIQAGSLVFSP